uniref:Peroxisomal biosis factor 13 n=1 Tax=Propithecus coquereli TaxID=379532 RepID=A0A2K6GB35_PROCO
MASQPPPPPKPWETRRIPGAGPGPGPDFWSVALESGVCPASTSIGSSLS